MFLIQDLYVDYVHQSTESLILMIKNELSASPKAGLDTFFSKLDKCIQLTMHYTNDCQKSADTSHPIRKIHTRKSGEPYINHTLRVALILIAEKITEQDVIFAAIMHDLYEDTTFTYKMAEEEFGENVAKLIECVTNVSESQNELANNAMFSAEIIDYTNIINRCRTHKIAFYIKFADRLDNLATLSAMPKNKQLAKISDTRKFLLPLMDRLSAKRFKAIILDAIFKIESSFTSSNDYQYIKAKIQRSNAFKAADRTALFLKDMYCSNKKRASNVIIAYPTCYEIAQHLKSENILVKQFGQDKICYDIFILTKESSTPLTLAEVIKDFIYDPALKEMAIECFAPDSFMFMDDIGDHYNLHVLSPYEYSIQQYGSTENDIPIMPLGSIEDELSDDKILVFPVDSKPVYIIRGATVIDLAVLCGYDIWKFLAWAKINGKNVDMTTELHDQDEVEIAVSPEPHPTVNVYWLLHCKTQKAKIILCEYLQNTIDNLIAKID